MLSERNVREHRRAVTERGKLRLYGIYTVLAFNESWDSTVNALSSEIRAYGSVHAFNGQECVFNDFGNCLTSVQSGGVDMGVAGLTITDERLESVNFSVSYATGVQVVIVKEGSGITSLDDLAGKKIGVQLATTGDIYASDEFGDENVVKYNKGADAVQALVGGGIDAVIIDNEPAKSFVSNNDGLVILETEYAVEEYAIAVDKSNTELLKKINKAIEELIEDGTIDAIMDKYIKAE